jgi:fatty acid synthase subunit alpha, fungi type/fatty acid synthase subunit beta, fungi type
VAARHSKVANRPIKDMLGGVESALIKKLLDRYYGGDEANVPYIDYIGASPSKVDTRLASTYGIDVTATDDNVVYTLGSTLPPTEDWLETLAGAPVTWLRALLRSTNIVHGSGYQANPLKRLFAPRAHQRVTISYDAGTPTSISIVGAARSFGLHKPAFEAVSVKFDRASKSITVTIHEDRTDTSVPLSFIFEYRPEQGFAPIHEIVEGRNKRIKEFYWKLWFGDNQVLPNIDIRDTFVGPEVPIDAATVERFCSVIGNQGELFKRARNTEVEAPMDFAIVTGWQVWLFTAALHSILTTHQ